ncbi:TonB-dependent siderophore receptor [Marinobacterium mangrovicola]|uniref:Outer membrane receptor for ferric coprogen and ferric-rhodotorulic acid n=1 Tax=Marinobacterium mangrovicola TaxID=1476959 RepID=A0A4V2PEC4_9GAMM|nr:TonB-dependent siderophore receptor [Marinobacterium mangrovicola]TCK08416.1 outer membrane receptor for ferric coprogen and ferric-rhodotorulic acid [Marinobacterium mangrovicola]
MKIHPSFPVSALTLAIAALIHAPYTQAADQQDHVALDTLQISDTAIDGGQSTENTYRSESSAAATRLQLTAKETPQTVTTVTRQQMDDFGLDGAKEVLDATPGVTVERVETDRATFTARGFDIQNFQQDGLGLPFTYDLLYGDMDTAMYDRIEVLRGANGLMTGTGSPSATVNYVRKRPTEEFQAQVNARYGSWDNRRIDADVSGALNKAGTVRGRLVGAHDAGDSYLDRYSRENNLFYGVVEADLTDSTLLTIGHSRQTVQPDAPLWGALPLFYTDGSATDYDVSTSTATDWAYLDNTREETFVELQQRFANGWQLKANLSYIESRTDDALFYVAGTPNAANESGPYAYPSRHEQDDEQLLGDVYASGGFSLGGREHEAVLGASWSSTESSQLNNFGQGIGTPLDWGDRWDGNYPKPSFDARQSASSWKDWTRSVYAAGRFSLTDQLNLIGGARYTSLRTKGDAYSANQDRGDSELTPYAGLVYDLTERHSVYASYTEIFRPQSETDEAGSRLDPVMGDAYEVGLKSTWLDGKLETGAALFTAKQSDLATSGGRRADNTTFYVGEDTESRGFELTLAGELAPRWHATAGFTYVQIEDDQGDAIRTFIPARQLKLATTYQPAALPQMKMGASVRWQDDIKREQAAGITTTQDAYALVDLMASYRFSENLSAQLNLKNLTDEKYLNSLYSTQSYYGEPRNASLSVSWKY